MKRLEHQKNLYKTLIGNESFKKETNALRIILKDSIWWVSEEGRKMSQIIPDRRMCHSYTKSCFKKSICQKRLVALLNQVKKTKKYKRFDCGAHRFGICIPVVQGDKIYGYVIICHSKNEISEDIIPLFINFIDTFVRELQKELELAKLYRTIRPRAIALSTIHTIHRIIGSTLNLDELLPKLARLCLQIFRVEKCCVCLKNQPKRPFVVTAISRNKNIINYDRTCARRVNREKILSRGKMVIKRNKLCVPLTDEDVIGAICVMNKKNKAPFDEFDKEILATLSEQAVIAIKNAQLYKEQENITIGSIKSLAAVLDTRTPGTYRVKESFIKIVVAIGRELNLNAEDLRNLHYAAILHDTGQIAFPDELFTKTDKLTGKEYSIIKRHPHKGVSIIKHLDFLKPVVPIILHHHENYDGSGYPKGLKRKKIPLGARIMAVASTFSTVITKRAYRQKLDVHSAIREIKKNSGTQFDPHVVKAFLKIIRNDEMTALLEKGL